MVAVLGEPQPGSTIKIDDLGATTWDLAATWVPTGQRSFQPGHRADAQAAFHPRPPASKHPLERSEVSMNQLPLVAALAVAAALSPACAPAGSQDDSDAAASSVSAATSPSAEPTLDEVRQATERFRDVNVALAEGYVRDPMNMCETAAHMGLPAVAGAMGVHFARFDLLEITATEPRVDGTGLHTDFLQPAVLLYEPQADGSLELVGVENLVFMAAWEAAGGTAPPSFHGVQWDRMVDDPATELDEAHMFAPHYDRHIWLYRDNPNGLFAQFNPAVTCDHHTGEHQQN